jgi:hypothetical protein
VGSTSKRCAFRSEWQKACQRQIPKKEGKKDDKAAVEAHRKAIERVCNKLIEKAFVQKPGDEGEYVWRISDDL